jgi:hypothetical protein
MTYIGRIVQAAAVISFLLPVIPAAGFGMGGGPGAAAPAVAVASPMGAGAAMSGGGYAAYAHGSPAATNPSVARIEAKQRDVLVAGEIDQMRKSGRNVDAADADLHRGELALASDHAEQAMLHFNDAERDIGIRTYSAAVGTSSKSALGSVTPGGTELSGAIVH